MNLSRGWKGITPPPRDIVINPYSPQAKGLLIWTPLSPVVYRTPNSIFRNYVKRTVDGVVDGISWGYSPQIGYTIDAPGNDFISWGDVSEVEGIDQITLSAWMRSSGYSTDMLWGKHDSGTDGSFFVGFTDENSIDFAVINAASSRITHNVAYTFVVNVWYHIACVYNGVDLRTYINGKHEGIPSAQTGLIKNTSHDLYLLRYTSGWYFDGRVAEPRIYDKALSAAEVWQMYDPATRWDLYKPINASRNVVAADPGRLLVAQAGSYVEFEEESLAVAQAGAYVEYQDAEVLDIFGPKIQVI